MGWKSCEYDGDKLTNVLSIQVTWAKVASNPDAHSRETQTNIVCRFCVGMPDVA